MNKKVIIIAIAVLVSIIGAVWAACVPDIAPLIVLLAAIAGFSCGVHHQSVTTSNICFEYERDIAGFKNEILSEKEKSESYAAELNSLKDATAKIKQEKSSTETKSKKKIVKE